MADDVAGMVLAGLATGAGGLVIAMVGRYAMAGRAGQTGDPTAQWRNFALERGWRLLEGADSLSVQGEADGQPLSATLKVKVRHTSRNRTMTLTQMSFRVPLRGQVPSGLLVRSRNLRNQLRGVLASERPIQTGHAALDSAAIVGGDDVDAVVILTRGPGVRDSMIALLAACPEATIDQRAITFSSSKTGRTAAELDRVIGLMALTASAIESALGSGDLAATLAVPTDSTPPLGPSDTLTAPPPLPAPRSSRLSVALRQIRGASSQEQRLSVQHLRLAPYRFELEVRSLREGVSRLGIKTGDLVIHGVLTRAPWRIELTVDASQADTALAALLGDVLRGECLLEDVRMTSRVVEVTARGPLTLEPASSPAAEAQTAPTGTGGGDPT